MPYLSFGELLKSEPLTKALPLAKHIIGYAYKKGKPLTNMGLNTVLYELFLATLAFKKRLLFSDEFIMRGFVCVPDVYYYYCSYGGMPIKEDTLSGNPLSSRYQALHAYLDPLLDLSGWQLRNRIMPDDGALLRTQALGVIGDGYPVVPLDFIIDDIPLVFDDLDTKYTTLIKGAENAKKDLESFRKDASAMSNNILCRLEEPLFEKADLLMTKVKSLLNRMQSDMGEVLDCLQKLEEIK